MTREFIIADTHFGHKNIIHYENRPFIDEDVMDEVLIKNWNDTVSKEDVVYHLGDVSFRNKEKTKEIMNQLNGKKTLIMGNHDPHTGTPKWWFECFDFVINGSLLIKEFIILSHAPVYTSMNTPYCNIHGHTHGDITYRPNTKRFCVSAEMVDYKPMLLTDIIRYFKDHI